MLLSQLEPFMFHLCGNCMLTLDRLETFETNTMFYGVWTIAPEGAKVLTLNHLVGTIVLLGADQPVTVVFIL